MIYSFIMDYEFCIPVKVLCILIRIELVSVLPLTSSLTLAPVEINCTLLMVDQSPGTENFSINLVIVNQSGEAKKEEFALFIFT